MSDNRLPVLMQCAIALITFVALLYISITSINYIDTRCLVGPEECRSAKVMLGVVTALVTFLFGLSGYGLISRMFKKTKHRRKKMTPEYRKALEKELIHAYVPDFGRRIVYISLIMFSTVVIAYASVLYGFAYAKQRCMVLPINECENLSFFFEAAVILSAVIFLISLLSMLELIVKKVIYISGKKMLEEDD